MKIKILYGFDENETEILTVEEFVKYYNEECICGADDLAQIIYD